MLVLPQGLIKYVLYYLNIFFLTYIPHPSQLLHFLLVSKVKSQSVPRCLRENVLLFSSCTAVNIQRIETESLLH